jgi:hypothetical protein
VIFCNVEGSESFVVIADLGVDDAGLGSVESERSNASVYHANFEKAEVRLYLDKFCQEQTLSASFLNFVDMMDGCILDSHCQLGQIKNVEILLVEKTPHELAVIEVTCRWLK